MTWSSALLAVGVFYTQPARIARPASLPVPQSIAEAYGCGDASPSKACIDVCPSLVHRLDSQEPAFWRGTAMTANTIDANEFAPTDDLLVEEEFDALADEGGNEEFVGLTKEESDRAVEEGGDFMPYIGEGPEDASQPVVDERPAEERCAELFERMKPRRRELLGILGMCHDPIDAQQVHQAGDEMQAAHRSVYNGEALCNLLVKAGALEKLVPAEQEPQVVVEDGVEYLKPAEKVGVQYVTTIVGQAMLDADKPAERLFAALEAEPQYKSIFLRVLKACAEDGGKTAKQLGELVDHDPLLQSPRRWAAYFFGILGECDALTWNQVWTTTEVGYQGIEALELEGVEA